MVKLIALMKRRKDMSLEDFIARYENYHARFATPYLTEATHYERRFITPYGNPVDGSFHEPDFDVMTEIWFEDREALDRTMNKIAATAADDFAADEEHLFDRPAHRLFVVEAEMATRRAY